MHVRMQSQENVEISNPMYLREDADEDVEPMEPTFALANKVCNCRIILAWNYVGRIDSHCLLLSLQCRRPTLRILFMNQCTMTQERVVQL